MNTKAVNNMIDVKNYLAQNKKMESEFQNFDNQNNIGQMIIHQQVPQNKKVSLKKQEVISSFIAKISRNVKSLKHYSAQENDENHDFQVIEDIPSFFERICNCFKMKKKKKKVEDRQKKIITADKNQPVSVYQEYVQNQLNNYQQKQKHFAVFEPEQAKPAKEKSIKIKQPQIINSQDEKLKGKKSLVIDLDETLVHSSFTPIQDPDFTVEIRVQNMPLTVYVKIRPGCQFFLYELSQYYELIIYTASLAEYAVPVINHIDRHKVCTLHIFRENCTIYKGMLVKDLSLMKRDLKDIIIIDNSEASFLFQPENAIHINSYFDDKKDRELYRLIPLLIFFSNTQFTNSNQFALKQTYDVRHVGNWWKEFEQNDYVNYNDRHNRFQRLNKLKMLDDLGNLRQKDLQIEAKYEFNRQDQFKQRDSQNLILNNKSPQRKILRKNSSVIKNRDVLKYTNLTEQKESKPSQLTKEQSKNSNESISIDNKDDIKEQLNKESEEKKEQLTIEIEDDFTTQRDLSVQDIESVKNLFLKENESERGTSKMKTRQLFNKFNEFEDYYSKSKNNLACSFNTQPDQMYADSKIYKEMRQEFENIRYCFNNQNINSPVSKQRFTQLLHSNSFRKITDKGSSVHDEEQHYFASPKKQISTSDNLENKQEKYINYQQEIIEIEEEEEECGSYKVKSNYDLESQRLPLKKLDLQQNCDFSSLNDIQSHQNLKMNSKQQIKDCKEIINNDHSNNLQEDKETESQIYDKDFQQNQDIIDLTIKDCDEIAIINQDENDDESTSTEIQN